MLCYEVSSSCHCEGRQFKISSLIQLLDKRMQHKRTRKELNLQRKLMQYNPKLEIDRRNFEYRQVIGDGNFGCVYKGMNVFNSD